MYTLDPTASGMYTVRNPRFGRRPIKEYVKSIDIKPLGLDGKTMKISIVTMAGRQVEFYTTGQMTLRQIINTLEEKINSKDGGGSG